jgi:hypothetical protein
MRETTAHTSNIGVACSTEPIRARVVTNLPPPYTWTGTRAGELRYVIYARDAVDTVADTDLQSQCRRLYVHSDAVCWTEMQSIQYPYLPPHYTIALFPRCAHRAIRRVYNQNHHARRCITRPFPTTRLLAIHILHPGPLQRRETSILHAPPPLLPRRPPLHGGPAQRRRRPHRRPCGPHKLGAHTQRHTHPLRRDPRLSAAARSGARPVRVQEDGSFGRGARG